MGSHGEELRQLARHYGIETSYRDNEGKRQTAPVESLVAVLGALGADVGHPRDAREALRSYQAGQESQALPRVQVIWQGENPSVNWYPKTQGVELDLEDEDGTQRTGRVKAQWAQSGAGFVHLPWDLSPGYYYLRARSGEIGGSSHLIVAPPTAYLPGPGRMWGLFIPLYALRSPTNWGVGDLGDLGKIMDWVAEAGGTAVGTLPLLATFLAEPFDPSPYNPVSRLFWNELFLSLEDLPELTQLSLPEERRRQWAAMRARLNRHQLVDYAQAMWLKRQVLELLSQQVAGLSAREEAFRAWVRSHPHAEDYARFRGARERGIDPAERTPHEHPAQRYHLYVQWNLDEQLSRMAGKKAGLYLDLPLGVHPDGYDQWRYGDLFARASVGAPPDAFFAGGQNWGFAPLHPEKNRRQGHAYFIASLRHHLRYAHTLRLDHVAWLQRLFWIPAGGTAAEGVYVQYPKEELYAILCLESHRHRTMLVGEDLGTMPAGLGRELVDRHLQRMYVWGLAEGEWPQKAPCLSQSRLVGLNTHDLPTFASFWNKLSGQARDRYRQVLGLARGGRHRALHGALQILARSRARFLLVNLEDLWGEEAPQNQPGTSGPDAPNWRRKAALTVPQIVSHPGLRGWLRRLQRLRLPGRVR